MVGVGEGDHLKVDQLIMYDNSHLPKHLMFSHFCTRRYSGISKSSQSTQSPLKILVIILDTVYYGEDPQFGILATANLLLIMVAWDGPSSE